MCASMLLWKYRGKKEFLSSKNEHTLRCLDNERTEVKLAMNNNSLAKKSLWLESILF